MPLPLSRHIPRPAPGEYPAYAEMYMRLVPTNSSILEHLDAQMTRTLAFAHAIPPDRLLYRYAAGKWSVKDVLVHIVDDERIFAYRALRFARNEQRNLIGFDQEAYAIEAQADARPLTTILDEYVAVRQATIALFAYLPDDSFDRLGHGTGTANDATVRALAYHIAGHELHHLAVLSDRYLA